MVKGRPRAPGQLLLLIGKEIQVRWAFDRNFRQVDGLPDIMVIDHR